MNKDILTGRYDKKQIKNENMDILIILAALLPALLLFLYIWKKDPQKEPTSWLIKAVLWGVAICFPAAILEFGIENVLFAEGGPFTLFGTTARAFIVAALTEEVLKLFALWMVLRKNPYFDEHFDGIVYAVCVGLGFAALENIFYLFSSEDWVATAITRSLLAVPGHYAFAVLMGYYYSVYHFVDKSPKTAICVLLVPIMAHGIYDALAMSGMVNPYIEENEQLQDSIKEKDNQPLASADNKPDSENCIQG